LEWIEIWGGQPLRGSVKVQGSKNTVLPILAATILHKGITVLRGCPRITDVHYMLQILEHMGCVVRWEEDTLIINTVSLNSCVIPIEYANKMRSSIFLLGSMLSRFKEARLPYPGGCVIGERPIELHLKGLQKLHVSIEAGEEELIAKAEQIIGGEVKFSFPSVGATENIILASVLGKGTTYIKGAAKEPEIMELCRFLNEMGADIAGAGNDEIVIRGVGKLHDVEFQIVTDRIVAGTYILATISSRGKITLTDAPISHMTALLEAVEKMGVICRVENEKLHIDATGKIKNAIGVKTEPYPGFPTDLQSQFMAVNAALEGECYIQETLFEARFKVAEELNKMGAKIKYDDQVAQIIGSDKLHGTEVEAKELRGGAALVVAAIGAKGVTRIRNRHFIDRGYEDICKDLISLGAKITCPRMLLKG